MTRTRLFLSLGGLILGTILLTSLGILGWQRYSAYEEIRTLWPAYKAAVEQHHEVLIRAGAIQPPAQAPRPQSAPAPPRPEPDAAPPAPPK